jgi:hypothetical protein
MWFTDCVRFPFREEYKFIEEAPFAPLGENH